METQRRKTKPSIPRPSEGEHLNEKGENRVLIANGGNDGHDSKENDFELSNGISAKRIV
jgi:hypothetical protein